MPLNKAQKQAVEYTKGPLLIVAGAGTGKTTVIAEKIAYLINEKGVKPEEILALTFTEKAAQEMVDRVDTLLSTGYLDLHVSTFHTFCERLLERYGLDIGLSNQFRVLTETDAWLLVRKHLYDFDLSYYRPLGNPSKHIHELLKHFSKCKDELITPEEYLSYAEGLQLDGDSIDGSVLNTSEQKRLAEIANAYHKYNQLLLDNSCLDFGDLIYYSVQLLQKRPNVLTQLQKRFTYILVDEFQDVNWSQYQLVRLLAGKDSQLTVVGDDDQSIYAFRGASVSNILRFNTDFPNATQVVHNENYRSSQKILDTAYTVIQHNNPDRLEVKLKIDKKLTSTVDSRQSTVVHHTHFASLDEEVHWVIEEIFKLKQTHEDTTWDDIAILVRANNHAEPFLAGLESAGIPYEFLASSGLYRQPIVIDCVNFFMAVNNCHDSLPFYRLLRMPFLDMWENDLQKLISLAKKKSITYYEGLKRSQEFQLSQKGTAVCDLLISCVHDGMKEGREAKPSRVLYSFLEKIGYLAYLLEEEGKGNRQVIRQIYHVQQFFDTLRQYETVIADATIGGFLDQYAEITRSGDGGGMETLEDTPDSVNILTIHGSKGLEFRHVFVVNMVEERFPSRGRSETIEIPPALIREQLPEGDGHVEEERRLFYVAATRAKEGLYFTSADSYGGTRKKKISRFLAEAKLTPAEAQKPKGAVILSKSSMRRVDETPGSFRYETPEKFSFSQIRSYQTCPYQYKLAHVLKIPTKGGASLSFGQTMHLTLQKFYERVQEINRVEQPTLFSLPEPVKNDGQISVPTLDELLELYKRHWIGDWYESKRQREEYYQKGKEILTLFYTSHEGNWTIPVSLEGWFKIKVGDSVVHGRIDRIDQLPDGSLEIIDYKTGQSKEKVAGEEKDQLLIYQIAVETLPEYKSIGKAGKLTFYYLNDNIRTSFVGDGEEMAGLKVRLEKAIQDIQGGDFTATPSSHICRRCDFKDICEYRVV